jgi:hypothetical protein
LVIAVKAFLDTHILDWILEDPDGARMLDHTERGALTVVVAADNA